MVDRPSCPGPGPGPGPGFCVCVRGGGIVVVGGWSTVHCRDELGGRSARGGACYACVMFDGSSKGSDGGRGGDGGGGESLGEGPAGADGGSRDGEHGGACMCIYYAAAS